MVAEEGRLLGSRALAAISTRGHTNKTVICREGSPDIMTNKSKLFFLDENDSYHLMRFINTSISSNFICRSAGGAFENLISYSSFIVSEVSTGLPRSVLNCFIDDNLEKAPLTLTKDVFLCWKDEDTLEIDMGW
ncbi:uncharacterized protein [Triticum aestivum]|uniref:uncharacterized protein n=1 Tax=Triticum aestivum TaxID=4565 RepID=UPI0008449581|nr:uncharacterized protein LOC123131600 [Triticum aestivum]